MSRGYGKCKRHGILSCNVHLYLIVSEILEFIFTWELTKNRRKLSALKWQEKGQKEDTVDIGGKLYLPFVRDVYGYATLIYLVPLQNIGSSTI